MTQCTWQGSARWVSSVSCSGGRSADGAKSGPKTAPADRIAVQRNYSPAQTVNGSFKAQRA
jgi:hypothetical protein